MPSKDACLYPYKLHKSFVHSCHTIFHCIPCHSYIPRYLSSYHCPSCTRKSVSDIKNESQKITKIQVKIKLTLYSPYIYHDPSIQLPDTPYMVNTAVHNDFQDNKPSDLLCTAKASIPPHHVYEYASIPPTDYHSQLPIHDTGLSLEIARCKVLLEFPLVEVRNFCTPSYSPPPKPYPHLHNDL